MIRLSLIWILSVSNALAFPPSRAPISVRSAPAAGGGGGGNTVTYDSTGPSSAGAASTGAESLPFLLQFGHTNNVVNNRCQFVGFSMSDNGSAVVTNVQIKTATTTNICTQAARVFANNSATSGEVQLWYGVAPPTGTNLVQIMGSAFPNNATMGGSVTLYNVNQTTPVTDIATSFGFTTSPSVASAGSSAQDMVLGVICDGSGFTANGQTLRWQVNHDLASGAGNANMQTVAGGGSGTISATAPNDFWAVIAVRVNHD